MEADRVAVVRTESGATMIEYALIVALIAVVIAGSASLLGAGVSDSMVGAANTVSGQSGTAGSGANGGSNGGSNNGQGGGWGGGVGGGQGHK